VNKMFEAGLESEARRLIYKYGPEAPGLSAPGYKAVREYIDGTLSLQQAKEKFTRADKLLAKRQLTWFKRNKDIIWCGTEQQVDDNVRDFLAGFATIKE